VNYNHDGEGSESYSWKEPAEEGGTSGRSVPSADKLRGGKLPLEEKGKGAQA